MNESVQNVVQNLLDKIGIQDAQLSTIKDEENKILRIEITTAESSLMIGRHGDTINALQHIAKSLLRKEDLIEDYFLVLDVDNYKLKQQENILNLAERKAENARDSGVSQFLPPMSPFYRKLVHMHFSKAEYEDVSTESIGEGEDRQVKIFKKEK